MAWKIEGTHFETCSCDVVGSCTASLALGADYDRRRVTLVFHVTSGDVDGADVSGLTVAAVTGTPKVLSDGNWRLGVFIDAGASQQPVERLGAVQPTDRSADAGVRWARIREPWGRAGADRDARGGPLPHCHLGAAVDFEIEDVVSFGVETGEPARLSGIFHPGLRADGREGDALQHHSFGIRYEGKAAFSSSHFTWAA
jgi:hypothetical protein